MRCLEQCGPDALQPAQLFPLFPTYTAPWAQQAPSHKPYWALHAPLHSLETLISRKLGGGAGSRHRHQQQQHGDAASASRQHSPSPEAPGSTASSSLFGLESGSAGAASPSAAASPTALAGEQHGDAAAADDGRGPQNGSLQHSAAGEAWAQQQQQQRGSKLPSTEWQQLQRRAWEALAQYLFRVGSPPFFCSRQC